MQEYPYAYIQGSKVFHRSNCCLLARSIRIIGCEEYKEAARKRLPCRVCKPEPALKPDPARENELVNVRLTGLGRATVNSKNIVGICHRKLHPGKLTRKLMEKHNCIEKNCPSFEMCPDSSYWIGKRTKKADSRINREHKKANKTLEKNREAELDDLRNTLQSLADDSGYGIKIIRLDRSDPENLKVFFVSDCDDDEFRYPNVFSAAHFYCPDTSVEMRHIRNTDGDFVTINEYENRRK